jgi:hypothetical protein
VEKRKERRNTSLKKNRDQFQIIGRMYLILYVSTIRSWDTLLINSLKGKEIEKNHAQVEDMDESTSQKKTKESKDEEYVFVSGLTDTITQGSDIWLVDNGASKHMTEFRSSLTKLTKRVHPFRWNLGMILDMQ